MSCVTEQNITVSIHAPHTGSDYTATWMMAFKVVSIHAPHTGSDGGTTYHHHQPARFNPRSPHGERRITSIPYQLLILRFQSTLPTRGATLTLLLLMPAHHGFNPRSPHGERRTRRCSITVIRPFQSTLPTRGATARVVTDWLWRVSVSIHAPHTGSDETGNKRRLTGPEFQSTLPTRGATIKVIIMNKNANPFQSTLPTRGATSTGSSSFPVLHVSIHAPHTGSDG